MDVHRHRVPFGLLFGVKEELGRGSLVCAHNLKAQEWQDLLVHQASGGNLGARSDAQRVAGPDAGLQGRQGQGNRRQLF